MKILCFEDWVDEYGMNELEEYHSNMDKEDPYFEMTEEEENDWLSSAYEEYVGYAEDRAYDEWKEKDKQ